jgi:hypothetical protein
MAYKLVNETTGREVKKGQVVKSFRGESAIVAGFQPLRSPSSTGRVNVYWFDDEGNPLDEEESSYYPGVFGLVIISSMEEL